MISFLEVACKFFAGIFLIGVFSLNDDSFNAQESIKIRLILGSVGMALWIISLYFRGKLEHKPEYEEIPEEIKEAHLDFIEKYKSNKIQAILDRNQSGFMYIKGLMPESKRLRQSSLRLFAFSLSIIGLILFFYTGWGTATLVLIAGMGLFPICQYTAMRDVLQSSIDSALFFSKALKMEVLKIKENASDSNN